MKKKLLVLLTLVMMVVGLSACTQKDGSTAASSEVNQETASIAQVEALRISGADLDKIMEDNKEKEKYLVIDVRPAEQYNEGHVKHAINMPMDTLADNFSIIEDKKNEDIIVICNTGNKSGKAQTLLQENGFTKVMNAEGVKNFEYTTMTKVTSVRGAQFKEMIESGEYAVFDAREEKDYNEGHLKGAVSATHETVEGLVNDLPKDKKALTYCYSGNRSFKVAQKLSDLGYAVFNSLDGTKEFDGYEFEK